MSSNTRVLPQFLSPSGFTASSLVRAPFPCKDVAFRDRTVPPASNVCVLPGTGTHSRRTQSSDRRHESGSRGTDSCINCCLCWSAKVKSNQIKEKLSCSKTIKNNNKKNKTVPKKKHQKTCLCSSSRSVAVSKIRTSSTPSRFSTVKESAIRSWSRTHLRLSRQTACEHRSPVTGSGIRLGDLQNPRRQFPPSLCTTTSAPMVSSCLTPSRRQKSEDEAPRTCRQVLFVSTHATWGSTPHCATLSTWRFGGALVSHARKVGSPLTVGPTHTPPPFLATSETLAYQQSSVALVKKWENPPSWTVSFKI